MALGVYVPPGDREVLESWLRASSVRTSLVQRARIVLLAAEGVAVKDIVERVGVSKPTVIGWKKRYAAEGVGGLEDRPKPGRRPLTDEVSVVLATLDPPPERLGVTHWSSRLLAGELGISHVWVCKIWRRWGLAPWRGETFTFATDPELEAKIRDVVGLYLNPPEKAVVLRVDEKPQQTHEYVRFGTATLVAALEVATCVIVDACYSRHRHQEFLRFLTQAAKAYPRQKLHLVCDNCGTHNHPRIGAWLARNPRIAVYLTSPSVSWLDLVEVFFSILIRQAVHRGSGATAKDLIGTIRALIDGWNDHCRPFTWIKTADELLDHPLHGTHLTESQPADSSVAPSRSADLTG